MTRRSRQPSRRSAQSDQTSKARTLRCAIYTRVSTDQGLEQDFNSLDAQREACAAYIRSQAHEGWTPVPGCYDDGGYSGGSLDRPALQALLDAVAQRQINVVVVYKVDRLTRSLADFAKLVEAFDAHGVSFISITQSFNTTTSMGRLTLNMLLSFAQFEREVTGERIRDKIAASKKKGIWVGGVVPLGYRVIERKLLIDEEEAKTVRLIFDRYLEQGSIQALLQDLRERGVVTRRRPLATGKTIGGIPFTKGPLAYLLKNRMYLGELNHGANSYPAEHAPLLPKELFDSVQADLASRAAASGYRQSRSGALLTGKLFDDRGHRMTPSYAVKGGVRYRYYISGATKDGQQGVAGKITRVPAADVERIVIDTLATLTALTIDLGAGLDPERERLRQFVERITIRPGAIEIALTLDAAAIVGNSSLVAPWSKTPTRVQREIIAPAQGQWEDPRAMSSDTRSRLLAAIGKARRWLDELTSGRTPDIEALAAREDRSPRSAAMLLSLAFLAPDLVKAIVENRMPRGIGLTRMTDLPSDWDEQRRVLGVRAP
jgi:DNA invertase Pin-like site-specific DNA recombinase